MTNPLQSEPQDAVSIRKLPVAMRHEVIMRDIESRGFVTTVDMAQRLSVSEMTLRRDLDLLAERGALDRTHGGAVARDKSTNGRTAMVEPSLEARASHKHDAKMAIAAHALSLVSPHQTIALDIGSTTLELALLLRDSTLKVFTSSLRIAASLKESRPEVYVPSGRIYGSEPSVVGASAVDYLRNQIFDIAFIGVSGVTTNGLYDYSLEDSEAKRALIERSSQTVLLIDDSKFDRTSSTLVARHKAIDLVISNAPMPQALHDAFVAAGVQVEITG